MKEHLGLLLGNPVDKSISDRSHNSLFQDSQIPAKYEKRLLSIENFEEEVQNIRRENPLWLAVTMPFKERICPLLDRLDPNARVIGSVNTIDARGGEWIGYNCDGFGALEAIEKKISVDKKKVLILGAGGTARAIAYEAKLRGGEVYVYNRTYERAQQMASNLGVVALKELTDAYDILINATSVGMGSAHGRLPIESSYIRPGTCIMDVIYSPRKTAFIEYAESIGCHTVLGEEMFIELSTFQLQLVFGKNIPVEGVRKSILSALSERTNSECLHSPDKIFTKN